ncbi:cytochrome P450 [Rhypophila decipiens]|uniref:Cytochrome P450 n=1 Tax=Rhypophila decipiens TaxID=261697 RepID=A0AAN7B0Z0_9PEZI|nr:cytochrome P450 [Rhypophila decipiens]
MSSYVGDQTLLLAALAGGAALIFLLAQKLSGHDPREPPLARPSIPIIGHLVGMARQGFNYPVDLCRKMNSPSVYTMNLAGQKMYVATKPDLIQTVQKQPKILAFEPIAAKFSNVVCGVGKEAGDAMHRNIFGDEPGPSLFVAWHKLTYEALRPGPGLDALNRIMIKNVAESLDKIAPANARDHRTIGMTSWLRDTITQATTRAVYGPNNPFEDPAIAEAFWEFEAGFMAIVANVLPAITARKALAARDKVANAIEAYYRNGGIDGASGVTKARYTTGLDSNIPLCDIAQFEVGGTIAVLVNTTPATFWTLFMLHAHPGLRDHVRKEIDACTLTSISKGPYGSEVITKTVEITSLKSTCPLLLSAYQETLRYKSMGTSVREVVQDTKLDGYLLKKGAMLQMPTRIIHTDESVWGPTVMEYNPRRFLPEEKANRPKDFCFRSFGGGKTLCPGRHFATNEVLAVVAVFLSRFDMQPVDEAKGWEEPTAFNTNVASVMMEPDVDFKVKIKLREGFENVKWDVRLDGGDKVFAMVTEDIAEA